MKKIIAIAALLAGFQLESGAQVKIGDNPDVISPGSLLELESTSKAFTLPRMTTLQMQAIPSPLTGMIVFNIDSNCIYLYKNNNTWASINPNVEVAQPWPYQTNDGLIGAPGNAKGIVAIPGAGLEATGSYSHAEGLQSVSSGLYSWSSGFADTATATASIAMGYQNKTSGIYGFSTGFKNVAAGQSSIALGQENTDSGWASLAAGLRNNIANQVSYSNTLGYNNQVLAGWSNNAFGENNQVRSGRANTAIGLGNGSDGNYNFVSGFNNNALAGNANFISGDNNQVLSGNSSFLTGTNNQSDGHYLGAIGKDNIVHFQSAVALGQNNRDSGYASIAGGFGNVIEKNVQFSSGFGFNNISGRNLSLLNTTPGAGTFSAGISNYNTGHASIALGGFNRPASVYGLSANFNTITNSSAMSAFGHYNDTIAAYPGLSFNGQEMLFAIGNGNSEAGRRNSLTMLRNGYTSINASGENGPAVPRAELDVKGTGAMIVPVGTTAERPATPVMGMIRFCTDCPGGPVMQGYNGTAWVNL